MWEDHCYCFKFNTHNLAGLKGLAPPDWTTKIDWEYIQKEIKSGVSAQTLYKEFSRVELLPSYQNFVRYFRLHKKLEKTQEVSLPIERIPGQTMEVDYSGDKMEILNPSTGEILIAELFVATLSYSDYYYAEFTFTQKLPVFLNSCKNAFEHIGSVPKFIVSDNCLTAVTKAEKHDVYLNKSFRDFCHHYNVTADPARVFRPKDKPHVENSIGIIQGEFFQQYRHTTFTSLFELNSVFKKYLIEKMDYKILSRGMSRNELLAIELPEMRDLPPVPFELFDYKKCKVHPDCHIRHQRNFYSVPYRFVGKEIEVKFNDKMIYAYCEADEIAIHSIALGNGHYITNKAHYPEDKLLDTNFHILSSLEKSKKIGPNTESLIKKLFEVQRNHPLRNLTKVLGVLSLKDQFSIEAIEYGAGASLESNKLSYNYIKSCVKNYRPSKEKTTLLPSRQMEFVCLQGGLL
ncbi:MAG: IS21 family transposase [Bacteriovorax sp.]|nr:IS21 family transposase [Bacteriovorax sp.]